MKRAKRDRRSPIPLHAFSLDLEFWMEQRCANRWDDDKEVEEYPRHPTDDRIVVFWACFAFNDRLGRQKPGSQWKLHERRRGGSSHPDIFTLLMTYQTRVTERKAEDVHTVTPLPFSPVCSLHSLRQRRKKGLRRTGQRLDPEPRANE